MTLPIFASADALTIYTDGSYCATRGVQAYGWVVENPTASMDQVRVVSAKAAKGLHRRSSQMEAAAVIDALWEFRYTGRHITILSDSQSLAHVVAKYRSGDYTKADVLASEAVILFADALRLIEMLDTVSFDISWVKAHSTNFHNLVVDQACRTAGLDGKGDAVAVRFALKALATGRAIVYGKVKNKAGKYYGTHYPVVADWFAEELQAA